MTTTQSLAGRLAAKEEAALADVYELYAPALLGYVRKYVGPDSAEDVLQQVFIDAWRGSHRIDQEARLGSWLFTIAHRRAVDELRSRKHQIVDVDLVRELIGDDGREMAQEYAEAAEVRAAVAKLPTHEREVIELSYFSDLTHAKIADQLDVPLGTVKARASRGTKRLASLLPPPAHSKGES